MVMWLFPSELLWCLWSYVWLLSRLILCSETINSSFGLIDCFLVNYVCLFVFLNVYAVKRLIVCLISNLSSR